MRLFNQQLQQAIFMPQILEELRIVDRHRRATGKRLHQLEICRRKPGGVFSMTVRLRAQ